MPDGDTPSADPRTHTTRTRRPGPPTREQPPLPPGLRLGRYLLREELGRGGMGVVYRAYESDLQREVALKLISDPHPRRAERFLGEIILTAKLQHPSIVPVHSKGRTEDGGIYYTMRLVQGRTLDRIIDEAPASDPGDADHWSRFKLLWVFVTVCRAVAYAHEQGVVHRDLKPSNLMLGDYGGVYVLDWGLATCFPLADPPGDGPREVVGTPAYMAPEQATGGPVGPPADIYGLGGILYAMLSGRSPRQGTQASAMLQILSKTRPAPPSAVQPSVAEALDAICLHALSPEPEDRPASALELASSVQAFLEGRPRGPAEGPDAEFLRTYRASDYARPSVTVDVVLLAKPTDARPSIFLRHRPHPPFAGAWSCPGSFVRIEESLEETARRVLSDEAGLEVVPPLRSLGTWGAPDRDPRTRVISVAYLAVVKDLVNTKPEYGAWFEVHELGGDPEARDAQGDVITLAFDHQDMLRRGLRES